MYHVFIPKDVAKMVIGGKLLVSIFLILLWMAPIYLYATTELDNSAPNNDFEIFTIGNTSTTTENTTEPRLVPLIPNPPEERAQIGFAISATAIFLIFIIYLIAKGGEFRLIRDASGYASLAKFQLLMWTIIIGFAFFGIYLTRIFGGVPDPPPNIPTNLLTLMGISIIVPALNKKASDYRYGPPEVPYSAKGSLVGMVQEGEGDGTERTELTRLQMFFWTLISVTIYLFLLYFTVNRDMADVVNLALPEIDGTLVVLMGLSQAGYLGAKIAVPGRPETTYTIQRMPIGVAAAAIAPVPINIEGRNFGALRGQIIYDDRVLDGGSITLWSNNRIQVNVPLALATAGNHNIIVITKNQVTRPRQFSLT
jgi:hypothetical protein